ncbi:MAG TPA: hypothetical protein DDW27_20015, partial [Bacteroidales bacterium]|nr:hypothetical protein [Bacteroidales bacterium]
MKKENTVFLFLTLIIPLMPAFSQNIKYTGTIEYNEVNICNVDGNGNDGTWRWMKKVNNIRDKNTTFNVVFVQGKGFEQIGMGLYSLNLISGDVKLTDNSFDESFREKIRETCLGEDEKGRLSKTWNVSPGESSYHRIRSNKTALDKPVISGMLMFQDGKYSLTIAGEMKELFTMEDYSQDKN